MRLRINEGLKLRNFTTHDYMIYGDDDLPSGKQAQICDYKCKNGDKIAIVVCGNGDNKPAVSVYIEAADGYETEYATAYRISEKKAMTMANKLIAELNPNITADDIISIVRDSGDFEEM